MKFGYVEKKYEPEAVDEKSPSTSETCYPSFRIDSRSPAFAELSKFDPRTSITVRAKLNIAAVAVSKSDENYKNYVEVEVISAEQEKV